jgi:hypothetical protein
MASLSNGGEKTSTTLVACSVSEEVSRQANDRMNRASPLG